MIAQVDDAPDEIPTTLLSPETKVGVNRSMPVPSPTCPLLFTPQHLTVNVGVIAQENPLPPESEMWV
jgi:hypothetical protein